MNNHPQPGRESVPGFEEPPPYSVSADELTIESGLVQANGRVDVNLESRIAQTLAQIINAQQEDIQNPPPDYTEEKVIEFGDVDLPFRLNIVIQIVGSRGDIQPFIALGTALKGYGHRVRIASHNDFSGFVRDSGLEFYPIGGDPVELMAYMIKNPGLIPQLKTLREGEVRKKQDMVAKMLEGCWRSCIEDDPLTQEPFVADAIIANPPSFAHIHCAQALGIPVHLMFTMPWSSTRAFPHPLANLTSTSMNPRTANWVSYGVVEWLTWQGLGDVINKWRDSINLDSVPMTEGPSLAEVLKVPFTYCWSPALIPKPQDWPSHIDICGFLFRDPPTYHPTADLEKFLQSGPPPIYIGFGSIVVSDPQRLVNTVLQAVAQAGVRAIISKGWSKITGPQVPNVYYIDDCPHEWLFQHVAAVVHHGGSGTTACGLRNSRPTAIVPFFGDQPFWGNMVARAGAGPRPIPYTSLTAHNLATAIRFCLTPEAKKAAETVSQTMQRDAGVQAALNSFHRNLPVDQMRCEIMPGQPASLKYVKGKRVLRLSTTVAQSLIEHGRIDSGKLKCYQSKSILIENRRWDPLTGVLSAATSTGSGMVHSACELVYSPYREYARGRSPKPSENPTGMSQPGLEPSIDKTKSQAGIVTAGKMVGATLQSFGHFTGTYFKGVVVDIPHAAAEGFRQIPQLYGEKPKEYQPIKDWQSGAIFAGRNFVDGMSEGLSNIITQPIKGAKKEGALGAVKGFAKGTVELATKVPSAGIGLVAYPLHGIVKSIDAAFRWKGQKAIVTARLRDGRYQMTLQERNGILESFERLLSA
ncbi:UDP-glucuronosyl/UDP-glucosyltransferase [Penicillium sp. IBT 18751x]|nr:UDP-glucuronosyl/UDP-glucosyltransferase [Penicillium sp. IBT 18751x]